MDRSIFDSLRIIESYMVPRRPKFQLSPEFAATMPAEWVKDYNQWMRQFFGEEEVIYMMDMSAPGMRGGQLMVMRPETAAMVRMYT